MKNEILKQIIEQIKKYKLTEEFSDINNFKKWAAGLNSRQINNFLSLDIDLEEIRELNYLLIDEDLLNCQDYNKRVAAISTLKNGDGCWQFFDSLCSPNFLKSKNFYKDIEMLSKADTAKYGLRILAEDSFINSPYHDEDLKLLVETPCTKKEKLLNYGVLDAIADVACNPLSINHQYHREDMKLLVTMANDCLQKKNSSLIKTLRDLAINHDSLIDKYHLENMQILAKNPIAMEFLYIIMTTSSFIHGKNYRKEIDALLNAKSTIKAKALYYYIVNPEERFREENENLRIISGRLNIYHIDDGLPDYYKALYYYINPEDEFRKEKEALIKTYRRLNIYGVDCNEAPDYLDNLIKINEIDDKLVMWFVSLLMSPSFVTSPYKDFDLELLQGISDEYIFMDLHQVMIDSVFQKSNYHKNDAIIISKSTNDRIRNVLVRVACNRYSINSINHEYDMEFISKLNLDSIDKDICDEIWYYLSVPDGINDPKHKEKLEKLLQGELVERISKDSNFLDELLDQIDSCDLPIVESKPFSSYRHKRPKFRRLIKKDRNERI